MIGYSFRNLACDVLQSTKKPMSAEQIWAEANELGIAEKVGSKGKTPWRSIQAQLYMDIKDGDSSDFVQLSKHPVLFGLKALHYGDGEVEGASDNVKAYVDNEASTSKKTPKAAWNERDLHPLLATYVRSDPHFHCYAKTVYQEKSSKKSKNADMWTHPDMVGVYFPFKDFEASTIQLQDTLRVNPYRIFSFELKKSLTTSHLREYFFQAVSNSSWANEGYLVAPSISSDSDFLDDLQRLSNAFGIGVIRLDIEHAEQSEILFQAQTHDVLDWSTVDRLSSINPDFRDFLIGISNTAKIHTVSGSFDKILEGDAYDAYLKKHGMALQMEFLSNEGINALGDKLWASLSEGDRLSIISPCFTVFAFGELKDELSRIQELRFLFDEPTFLEQIAELKEPREFVVSKRGRERGVDGTGLELTLRNSLKARVLAHECAECACSKAMFKSAVQHGR